jgi:hypothetical protein
VGNSEQAGRRGQALPLRQQDEKQVPPHVFATPLAAIVGAALIRQFSSYTRKAVLQWR